MKRGLTWIGLLIAWLVACVSQGEPPARRPCILAHVMPWYEARPFGARWGWHWTMNAFDPERIRDDRRDIASHYYPWIGPYDSADPSVIEYHLLLMKIAGIDGLIVDWYGRADHADYALLHRNCDLLCRAAERFGLRFAVCYEDHTIPKLVRAGKIKASERISQAQAEIAWLEQHWFRQKHYLRKDARPVLLSFGSDGLSDPEWERVLAGVQPVIYLSEHRRRSSAAGAFDWPIPADFPGSVLRFHLKMKEWPAAMPVAFPRFHDIYAEGKAQPPYPRIPDDQGQTWISTLARALRSGADWVQLATWNDWGEGTGIEPTREFGDRDLRALQRLRRERIDPDFRYTAEDLKLPMRIWRLRQPDRKPDIPPAVLAGIVERVAAGDLAQARAALETLEAQAP